MSERDKVREALAQLHCKHKEIKPMMVGTYVRDFCLHCEHLVARTICKKCEQFIATSIHRDIPLCGDCSPMRVTEVGTPLGSDHFYSHEWDAINEAARKVKANIVELRKQANTPKKPHKPASEAIKGHLDLMRRQRKDEI